MFQKIRFKPDLGCRRHLYLVAYFNPCKNFVSEWYICAHLRSVYTGKSETHVDTFIWKLLHLNLWSLSTWVYYFHHEGLQLHGYSTRIFKDRNSLSHDSAIYHLSSIFRRISLLPLPTQRVNLENLNTGVGIRIRDSQVAKLHTHWVIQQPARTLTFNRAAWCSRRIRLYPVICSCISSCMCSFCCLVTIDVVLIVAKLFIPLCSPIAIPICSTNKNTFYKGRFYKNHK